jgi:hypothetical protein
MQRASARPKELRPVRFRPANNRLTLRCLFLTDQVQSRVGIGLGLIDSFSRPRVALLSATTGVYVLVNYLG